MKQTKPITQLERTLNISWAVRIYDYNQRLMCTLTSARSHTLLTSAIAGLVMAIVGVTLTHPASKMPATVESMPTAAPLQLD